MKKKLATLAVLALAVVAFSQETRFGLRYGLDMSFLDRDGQHSSTKADTNGLAGFHFGIVADMCGDLFCFQPGFMFRQRGGEFVIDGGSWTEKTTTKMWYLEWPVMFSLRVPFGEIAALKISAGPYLALGLFGGVEKEYKSNTLGNKESFEKTFTKNYFNRFDAGVNLGSGIDVQAFYIGISYSLGVIDISQKSSKDMKKAYNRALGVTLDYYL
ncbi:MAG: PorT family protein [Fibromonadaceae bacterium]|jgi:hypothetical protein|nr:PorT family protein [Fibromonadaceae bacterium]